MLLGAVSSAFDSFRITIVGDFSSRSIWLTSMVGQFLVRKPRELHREKRSLVQRLLGMWVFVGTIGLHLEDSRCIKDDFKQWHLVDDLYALKPFLLNATMTGTMDLPCKQARCRGTGVRSTMILLRFGPEDSMTRFVVGNDRSQSTLFPER